MRTVHEVDDDMRADAQSLVMVAVLFIVCNALALSVTFMELLMGRYNTLIRYAIDVSNLLVTLNSSMNAVVSKQ